MQLLVSKNAAAGKQTPGKQKNYYWKAKKLLLVSKNATPGKQNCNSW